MAQCYEGWTITVMGGIEMTRLQCPEYYADHARYFEKNGLFSLAAEQWNYAAAASAGHKRRLRYYEACDRCEKKAGIK